VNSHSSTTRHFSAAMKPTVKTMQPSVLPKSSPGQKGVSNTTPSKFGCGDSVSKTPARCWRCSGVGHKSYQCSMANSNASAEHPTFSTPKKAPKQETVSQAKVIHVKVELETQAIPRYTSDFIPKLRILNSTFYTELENHFRSSIQNYDKSDVECGTVASECDVVSQEAKNLICSPSETMVSSINVSDGVLDTPVTESALPDVESPIQLRADDVCDKKDKESGKKMSEGNDLPLQLSQLQYTEGEVKGISDLVCALKDTGSEICLINQNLISDLDVNRHAQVVIRNAIGARSQLI